jgi:hypothetical protein
MRLTAFYTKRSGAVQQSVEAMLRLRQKPLWRSSLPLSLEQVPAISDRSAGSEGLDLIMTVSGIICSQQPVNGATDLISVTFGRFPASPVTLALVLS